MARHRAILFSLFVGLFQIVEPLLGQSEESLKSQNDVVDRTQKSNDPSAYRILYIGDSITRHGTNPDIQAKIGWDHLAGMAASRVENDYVHRFAAALQKDMPDRKVEIYIDGFGKEGSVAGRLAAIDKVLTLEPHLVVIQLGEHEKESDGVDFLRQNLAKLLLAFDGQASPPWILCAGPWSPGGYTGWTEKVEKTMAAVCAEYHVPYISVADLAVDSVNRGWGTHPGVKWHPNDAGHAGYAARYYQAFKSLPAGVRTASKMDATIRPAANSAEMTLKSDFNAHIGSRLNGQPLVGGQTWKASPELMILNLEGQAAVGVSTNTSSMLGAVALPTEGNLVTVEAEVVLKPDDWEKSFTAIGFGDGTGYMWPQGILFLMHTNGFLEAYCTPKGSERIPVPLSKNPAKDLPPGMVKMILQYNRADNTLTLQVNDIVVAKKISLKEFHPEMTRAGFSAYRPKPNIALVRNVLISTEP